MGFYIDTREGSPNLRTGIPEQFFRTARKLPSLIICMKSKSKRKIIESLQLKNRHADILSGPLKKLFFKEK